MPENAPTVKTKIEWEDDMRNNRFATMYDLMRLERKIDLLLRGNRRRRR